MSFLVWSLLLSLTLIKDGEGAVSVKECTGSKIAILDLSDLSGVGNFPKCELDNVRLSYRRHQCLQKADTFLVTQMPFVPLYRSSKPCFEAGLQIPHACSCEMLITW